MAAAMKPYGGEIEAWEVAPTSVHRAPGSAQQRAPKTSSRAYCSEIHRLDLTEALLLFQQASSDGGHIGAEGITSPGPVFGRGLPPPSPIAVSNRIEGGTGLVLPFPGRRPTILLTVAVRRTGICAAQDCSGRRNDGKCRQPIPHGDLLPSIVVVAERALLVISCIVRCGT